MSYTQPTVPGTGSGGHVLHEFEPNCAFAQFPCVDDRVDSRAASVYGSQRPGSMGTPANGGAGCRSRRLMITGMKGVDHGDRTG